MQSHRFLEVWQALCIRFTPRPDTPWPRLVLNLIQLRQLSLAARYCQAAMVSCWEALSALSCKGLCRHISFSTERFRVGGPKSSSAFCSSYLSFCNGWFSEAVLVARLTESIIYERAREPHSLPVWANDGAKFSLSRDQRDWCGDHIG